MTGQELRTRHPDLADGAPYYGDFDLLARDLNRLVKFEATHEATDTHLRGLCDCPEGTS